jgi:hypothetical protein
MTVYNQGKSIINFYSILLPIHTSLGMGSFPWKARLFVFSANISMLYVFEFVFKL